jgi:cation transport ATPase
MRRLSLGNDYTPEHDWVTAKWYYEYQERRRREEREDQERRRREKHEQERKRQEWLASDEGKKWQKKEEERKRKEAKERAEQRRIKEEEERIEKQRMEEAAKKEAEERRRVYKKRHLVYVVGKTVFSVLYWLGVLAIIRKVYAIYIPTPMVTMVRQVILYSFVVTGIAFALIIESGVWGCIICGIIGAIIGWFVRFFTVGGYAFILANEHPLKIVIPLLFPLITIYILVMTKWSFY